MDPRVWAEIDLSAIQSNLALVRRALPPRVQVLAVVKADAYGHGAVPIAKALLEAGAHRLGVSSSTEALALREHGFTAPISILGALVEQEIADVVYHRITPTIHTRERIPLLAAHARRQGVRLPVHLKVDTGMSRLGARPESMPALVDEVLGWRRELELEGISTHFASAESDAEATREQLVLFRRVLDGLARRGFRPRLVHAANSAATLALPEARFDMVRPGGALLGIDPGNLAARGIRLKPALSLRSQVLHLKGVRAGTRVGYAGTHVAPRDTRLATVPVGYDDGYPWALGNRASVLVRGCRARVVGRVSMDYITVDVGHVPGVEIGDLVTLVGWDPRGSAVIRLEELAQLAQTIPYELTCRLSRRVRRVYHAGLPALPPQSWHHAPAAPAASQAAGGGRVRR